jgi:hypothetical protein
VARQPKNRQPTKCHQKENVPRCPQCPSLHRLESQPAWPKGLNNNNHQRRIINFLSPGPACSRIKQKAPAVDTSGRFPQLTRTRTRSAQTTSSPNISHVAPGPPPPQGGPYQGRHPGIASPILFPVGTGIEEQRLTHAVLRSAVPREARAFARCRSTSPSRSSRSPATPSSGTACRPWRP